MLPACPRCDDLAPADAKWCPSCDVWLLDRGPTAAELHTHALLYGARRNYRNALPKAEPLELEAVQAARERGN